MKKVLYFAPRILSILFCGFIFMFSLDVFEEGRSWGDILIGLFMHNIPVMVMAVVTFFAWKSDAIGLIGFGGIGILLSSLVFRSMGPADGAINPAVFIVAGPAFFIAALYGYQVYLQKKAN